MKTFKRVILFVLIALLAFSAVGCKTKKQKAKEAEEQRQKELAEAYDKAKSYVFNLYVDDAKATASDYEVISKIAINGTTFEIEWKIEIVSGEAEDVKLVPSEDGASVKVDVNENAQVTTEYKLIATIKGSEKSATFLHTVPAFKYTSYEEWLDACKKGSSETLIIKGYVTAVVGEGSSSAGSFYFQDADGHGYYAYAPSTKLALEYGDEVLVKGTGTVYGGQYEFNKNCTFEKTGEKATNLKVNEGTSDWAKAAGQDDESLIPYQNALVKLTGCTMANIDGSYYYFTVGESTVKFNLYDTYYFLTEAQRKAITDQWAAGKTFDIVGLVSCYSKLYQIYPISEDCLSNVAFPQLSDAEAIAIVKESLALSQVKFENDTQLAVDVAGYNGQVTIAWAADNDQVVFADGKLVITLGEEDVEIKVTATLTAGEATDTKEFTITLLSASSDVYVPAPVEEAAAGTYKFVLYQASLGKYLYADGTVTSAEYLATTEKADKAADFVVAAIEGKTGEFTIAVGGKFVEIYENADQKVRVHLVDEATGSWKFNADAKVYTFELSGCAKAANDGEYYLGTYNTYNTMSASKTSYITGDNAANVGKSQFPATMATLAPGLNAFEPKEEVAAGTYKFALYQATLGKTLYADGTVTSAEYLATTEKADKAADFVVAAIEGKTGEFTIAVGGKFVEIYENADQKVRVHLVDEATGSWKYDADAKVLAFELSGCAKAANDGVYYLGTYNTYNTMSASKTTYITGDNAANVGKSQFPAYVGGIKVVPAEFKGLEEAAAGTYKFALYQATLGKTLYADGTVTSAEYLATTEKYSKGADFVVAAIEGKTGEFTIAVGGKFVEIYENADQKVRVHLVDEATGSWKFDADAKVFTFELSGCAKAANDGVYYLGTYNTYNTMSASKTTYITGDNAANVGKSQFPAYMGDLAVKEEGGEEEPPFEAEHAGTAADPYSVADALGKGAELDVSNYGKDGGVLEVWVKGYVVDQGSDAGDKSNNIRLADEANGETSLLIFTVNETEDIKDVRLNDLVVIHGYLVNWSGTIEVSSTKVNDETVYPAFVSCERGQNNVAVAANSSDKAEVKELSLTSGLNGTSFTFKVEVASGYEIAFVKVNDENVEAVDGVYTSKILGPTSISVETIKQGEALPQEATMEYKDSTKTTNMTGEENQATIVSLDPALFTVIADKGTNNNFPGLNKALDIRIYKGNILTVSVAEGYYIKSIKFTYTEAKYGTNTLVEVGGKAVEGTDGAFEINATSFVLKHSEASNDQVRFSSLVISYVQGEAPAPAEVEDPDNIITYGTFTALDLGRLPDPANAQGYGSGNWDSYAEVVADPLNPNNKVLKFAYTVEDKPFASFFKFATVKANTTYVIELDYLVEGRTDNFGIRFAPMSNPDIAYTFYAGAATDGWQHAKFELTTVDANYDSIGLWFNTAHGEINIGYVDNIVIKEKEVTPQPELVVKYSGEKEATFVKQEDGTYVATVELAAWKRISFSTFLGEEETVLWYDNTTFTGLITAEDKLGDAWDGSLYHEADDGKQWMPGQAAGYKFTYDPQTKTMNVGKYIPGGELQYGGAKQGKFVKQENGTYVATLELAAWNRINFTLLDEDGNETVLWYDNTTFTGLITAEDKLGDAWDGSLYHEADDGKQWMPGQAAGYKFTYDPQTKTMNVGKYIPGGELNYGGEKQGKFVKGEDGLYTATVSLNQWKRISFALVDEDGNETALWYDNTTFTGKITAEDKDGDQWDGSLYHEAGDGQRWMPGEGPERTYKFEYNAETRTMNVILLDTTKPTITISDAVQTALASAEFFEGQDASALFAQLLAGISANDDTDGAITVTQEMVNLGGLNPAALVGGDYTITITVADAAGNVAKQELKIHVKKYANENLLADLPQSNGDYKSANWTVEKYTSAWEVQTSVQMRSRASNSGVRVANMANGWGMTMRYTYSTGESLGIANKLSLRMGNYWSNAQAMSIKIKVVTTAGQDIYILGSASEFYSFHVTTDVEDIELPFDAAEIKSVVFVTKSSVQDSTYLYIGNVLLTYEEPVSSPASFQVTNLEAEGNNRNHIEGAGAWIWIDPASIGLTGANLNEFEVAATCETLTVSNAFLSDYSESAVRCYVVFASAPGAEDTTVINITLTHDGVTYQGTVSFVGNELA